MTPPRESLLELLELLELYDKKSYNHFPMFHGDWRRISHALRLAMEWLEEDEEYDRTFMDDRVDRLALWKNAREAFRRAVEGSPDDPNPG